MEPLNIKGLVAAVVTPMTEEGELRLDMVPRIVEHLSKSGVVGIYIAGSTGEGMSLTGDERRAVAKPFGVEDRGGLADDLLLLELPDGLDDAGWGRAELIGEDMEGFVGHREAVLHSVEQFILHKYRLQSDSWDGRIGKSGPIIVILSNGLLMDINLTI